MRHMGIDRRKERGAGNRAMLFTALWTLIAVTLLSALAPLGPPLSRARGSAFNPATSEVAVKARTAIRVETSQARRPDGGNSIPMLLLCVAVLCLLGGSKTAERHGAGPLVDPLPHPALAAAHRARAPPALA